MQTRTTRTIYVAAIGLAFVALALGLWDFVVRRDGGESVLLQLVFPAALLVIVFILYRRSASTRAGA